MARIATHSRRTVRQSIARFLGYGQAGTTTAAGDADKKSLIDTQRVEEPDFWIDGQVHITSTAVEGETSRVQATLRTTGEIEVFPAFSALIASGATYEIYHREGWLKQNYDDGIAEAIEWGRHRFLLPCFSQALSMASSTYVYDLPYHQVIAATADAGGTTTTLVDASALTQADDYWNGAILIVTADAVTAANVGEVRVISDSDEGDTKLTWKEPLPGAADDNTTYRLIRYPFTYIHRVRYQESGGEWLDLPGGRDSWRVDQGLYPRLILDSGSLQSSRPLWVEGQRYPGDVEVDLDLVEMPLAVVRPYVEYYLRRRRSSTNPRQDAYGDAQKAREAREEAEIGLEQQTSLPEPGSRRAD